VAQSQLQASIRSTRLQVMEHLRLQLAVMWSIWWWRVAAVAVADMAVEVGPEDTGQQQDTQLHHKRTQSQWVLVARVVRLVRRTPQV